MADTFDYNKYNIPAQNKKHEKKKSFDYEGLVNEWCKNNKSFNPPGYQCVCNSNNISPTSFNRLVCQSLPINYQFKNTTDYLSERVHYICNSPKLSEQERKKCRKYTYHKYHKSDTKNAFDDIQTTIDKLNPVYKDTHYLSFDKTSNNFKVPLDLPENHDTVNILKKFLQFFKSNKVNQQNVIVKSIHTALDNGIKYYSNHHKANFGCPCNHKRHHHHHRYDSLYM